jgi:aminopeptidase N
MEAAGNDSFNGYWELCSWQADSVNDLVVNIPIDENFRLYHNLYYGKGALFLKELMDALGKEEFLLILSIYCETYAFRFATTESFLDLLRERAPVNVERIIQKYLDC